ncbi:hypothetical protein ACFV3T_10445 [Streptomyces albidoflavus]
MTEERNANPGPATELGPSAGEQIFVSLVFLVGGAGLGWLLELLASWLVTLPWAPMQGPAELITSIPQPGLTIGLVVVGALVGLVAGFAVQQDELKLSISGEAVRLTRKENEQYVPGSGIAAAFLDDKQLVLLGRKDEELAREKCDLGGDKLSAAFSAHGYTWIEQDPHRAEFRPWVSGTPGLPEGANALFTARQHALKKSKTGDEQRELREELAKLGLVVRDDKGRQYWRETRTIS